MYCEAGGEARLGSIGGHSGHGTVFYNVQYGGGLGGWLLLCSLCGDVLVVYQEAPGQGEGRGQRLTIPFLVSQQCIPSLPSWSTLLS